MRDQFQWDRTTENFYRYTSNRAEPIDTVLGGKSYHYVVYIPRKGGPEIPPFRDGDFILSRMTNDQLAMKTYGEPIREPILRPLAHRDIYGIPEMSREDAKTAMHATLYGSHQNPRDYPLWSKVIRLEEKYSELLFAQDILFKAVYWLLKKFRVVK